LAHYEEWRAMSLPIAQELTKMDFGLTFVALDRMGIASVFAFTTNNACRPKHSHPARRLRGVEDLSAALVWTRGHDVLAAVDGSLNLRTGKTDVAQRVIVESVQLADRAAHLCVFHDLLADLHL
jgi:hypothetical protein